jgi:hypothetical protein
MCDLAELRTLYGLETVGLKVVMSDFEPMIRWSTFSSCAQMHDPRLQLDIQTTLDLLDTVTGIRYRCVTGVTNSVATNSGSV